MPQQYEDVVYLKNGSIIHGTIVEQVPNESVKIKTNDGNVFVYKIDEINKITKEEIKGEEKSKTESKSSFGTLWLGFFAGLNFSNISISSPSQSQSGPDGVIMPMFGVFGERMFNQNFGIQTELSYVRRGADKVSILGYYPCSVSADYLNLDVLLKGKIGMESFDPYGIFGTFIGIKLSANAEHNGQSVDWASHVNDLNLGLYFGAGGDIKAGKNLAIMIEFRYGLGVQNLNKDIGTSSVTSNGLKLLGGLKFKM